MSSYQEALDRIKKLLKNNPKGMSVTDIANKIKINRNTVAKYLDVLLMSGHVEMRLFGPAKAYFPASRIPLSTMLNISSDLIVMLSQDLTIFQVNSPLLDLLAVNQDDLVGKKVDKIPFSAFTGSKFLSNLQEARNGKEANMEISFRTTEGFVHYWTKLIPTTFDSGDLGVTIILEDITERKHAEHKLGERVKELNCLYGIAKIVERPGIILEEVFQETVRLIPPSWQYPEITGGAITYGDQVYTTEKFHELGRWVQTADIIVRGKNCGVLAVSYEEERPNEPGGEGPFLMEERFLIDAIAERLGRTVERKESELTLQESEEKYRNLFEHANDSIFILDPSTRGFLDVNENAAERLGYTKDELLQLTLDDIYLPLDKDWRKELRQELEETGSVIFERVQLHKDGTEIPVEVSTRYIEYSDQRVLQSFIRDLSERKKTEDALRESEQRYKTLFENANDAIFIHDFEGRFLEVNPTACERLGYTREELLELNFKDIDSPDFAHLVPKRMAKLQKDGHIIVEAAHIRKDGTKLPIELSARIIEYDGKPAVLSIARDISERK